VETLATVRAADPTICVNAGDGFDQIRRKTLLDFAGDTCTFADGTYT
jgi:hypothetical protein